ncbi:pyridoxamine kinase [Clostridium sp. HCP1S3_B4]|uniref:pyridoxamine kinase n=1 Tax=unclassified Clostridium TaxID=2614128 RepID=UPI0016A03BE0|nr:pyridoxamine kinase [Clostridiales bacterium]MDY2730552.1 pyridoxamine kinase [Clostridium sp.]NLK24338.1 pyridoxamine kinase [Clostridiales bacterium]
MGNFRQKRIALVNDLTGFGRCSVAVALPIISALKVQCCFLPTAILSNHTGFDNFFFEDYTPKMREYIENWEKIKLNFDGICTGFLGSSEQIDIVMEFLDKFKKENTLAIIDPVMGDYGKLYCTYTDEMCSKMQHLVQYADVLTPNLTELCRLLDIAYPSETPTHKELYSLCETLAQKGPSKIVVTGLQRNGYIENFIFQTGKPYEIVKVKKVGVDRSGTGDVFTSIVAASVVKNEDFAESVQKAADFISKALAFTTKMNLPTNYGVCFEEFLTELK